MKFKFNRHFNFYFLLNKHIFMHIKYNVLMYNILEHKYKELIEVNFKLYILAFFNALNSQL